MPAAELPRRVAFVYLGRPHDGPSAPKSSRAMQDRQGPSGTRLLLIPVPVSRRYALAALGSRVVCVSIRNVRRLGPPRTGIEIARYVNNALPGGVPDAMPLPDSRAEGDPRGPGWLLPEETTIHTHT